MATLASGTRIAPGKVGVLRLSITGALAAGAGFILAFCAAGAAVTILVTETTKWVMRRR